MPEPEEEEAGSGVEERVRGGPPLGFGKNVNDYLNQYITVTDTKAGALLAGALAAAAFLFQQPALTGLPRHAHTLSLMLLFLTIVLAGAVIFPRLPHGREGVIFWEDIHRNSAPDRYWDQLSTIDDKRVERAFADQNFYVSQVLHEKSILIRWAMVTFLLATAAEALSHLSR